MNEEELIKNLCIYRTDPWRFCADCVYTIDPQDREMPIKKFPSHLEYLRLYTRLWERENLIAVPKSRRMFMSWMNICLYLWDTMFHFGRHNAIVSKKEDDADALIERCLFVLDHIPTSVLPKEVLPKWKRTFTMLEFPELNSKIQAFPSGSDKLRSYGFSGVLNDEMAFQEDAKDMYSSTFPTIENKGRFTAISSPKKSFFQELVFDNLDNAPQREMLKQVIPGVEMWKNQGNKFLVFQTHYSADPRKKGDRYIAPIRASMPMAQFKQEFELLWESFEGKCVYPDWNREIHGSKITVKPTLGLPLLLGVDQGLMPAAVVCQLQEETLVVLKEYIKENMGAERFSEYVKDQLRIDFPGWPVLNEQVLTGMDPTGFSRRDVDERTYASAWTKQGFKPFPGANLWEQRRQAVERWLIKFRKGYPCFKVNLPDCPILAEGFDGGYRYPDNAFDIEPNKIRPVKDQYSQPHDALQYILTLLEKKMNVKTKAIPSPNYAWSAGNDKRS